MKLNTINSNYSAYANKFNDVKSLKSNKPASISFGDSDGRKNPSTIAMGALGLALLAATIGGPLKTQAAGKINILAAEASKDLNSFVEVSSFKYDKAGKYTLEGTSIETGENLEVSIKLGSNKSAILDINGNKYQVEAGKVAEFNPKTEKYEPVEKNPDDNSDLYIGIVLVVGGLVAREGMKSKGLI